MQWVGVRVTLYFQRVNKFFYEVQWPSLNLSVKKFKIYSDKKSQKFLNILVVGFWINIYIYLYSLIPSKNLSFMQLNFHLSRLFGFTMWHWNHWMNSLGCQPCWRRYWMSTGSLNLFPGWNPFDTTRGLLSSLPPGVGIATVVKKLGCFFPRHENEGANYWRQSTVNVCVLVGRYDLLGLMKL